MRVVIAQGDKLVVQLEGTDGEFEIEYGSRALTVKADLPDTKGREGVIYSERFIRDEDEDEDDVDSPRSRPCRNVPRGDETFVVGQSIRKKPKPRIKPKTKPKNRPVHIEIDYEKNTRRWPNKATRNKFLNDLEAVQENLTTTAVKGIERCDHCRKIEGRKPRIGTGDYYRTDNDVRWPESLSHHIFMHDYMPETWFREYIRNKRKN